MRVIKAIVNNLHRFVLWFLISAFLWAFVFMLAASVPASKKVVVYLDVPAVLEDELEDELQNHLSQGIKAVEVHPFSYDIFASGAPSGADIYIVPESRVALMHELLCPITGITADGLCVIEGQVFGLEVYTAATDSGHAMRFITYKPDTLEEGGEPGEGENCFLCFSKSSKHLGEMNGSADSAAVDIANAILNLP